jgi:trehalose 6-phosphate synthase/phosphatase
MERQKALSRLHIVTEKANRALNRLILLDFDGTLVDFTPDAATTVPSKQLLLLLRKIAEAPNSQVIIITGRTQEDIDRLVGHLPLNIVAEHGAMIRENNQWRALLDEDTSWKNMVFPIISRFTVISPNSFLEEKNFSLAWHYRNVESDIGKANSRALIRELEKVAPLYGLKILDGKKVVEIVSRNTSKGLMVKYLTSGKNFDFIIALGDDITDEDMFSVLANDKNAFTLKIGPGNTSAKYTLKDIGEALFLLEQLQSGLV